MGVLWTLLKWAGLLLLLYVGFLTWKYFESKPVAQAMLDYSTMDARGLEHKYIQVPFQECIRGNEQDEYVKNVCACHMNGILHNLTNEELIVMYDGKTPITAEHDEKVRQIAIACRQQFTGK